MATAGNVLQFSHKYGRNRMNIENCDDVSHVREDGKMIMIAIYISSTSSIS